MQLWQPRRKQGLLSGFTARKTPTWGRLPRRTPRTCGWLRRVTAKPLLRSKLSILIQGAHRLKPFHLRFRDDLSHFFETLPDCGGIQFNFHRSLVQVTAEMERQAE